MKYLMWALAAFLAYALFWPTSPEQEIKNNSRNAVSLCWSEQSKPSNAGVATLIAQSCERMAADFEKNYGVRP